MTRRHAPLFMLPLLAVVACKDPAADKPKAQVAEAAPKAAEAPASAAVGEILAINPERSRVQFVGSKVTGSHEGGFKFFEGKVELPKGAPESARISVKIDTTSVFTDNEKLTGHLQSPDFFDVQKFPSAVFESTEIKPAAANGATHQVTGTLDLHGVKKQISFPATITVTPESAAAKAEFAINRKDFGIVYAGKPDDLIRDDVVIKLDIQAPRSAAPAKQ